MSSNFLKKFFFSINTNQSEDIKAIYNQGVLFLSDNRVEQAIKCFEQVADIHPSAAYNLGLIYLDGAHKIMPNFDDARKYFKLAYNLGHEKAQKSAIIIDIDKEHAIDVQKYSIFYPIAILHFITARQSGNLAYMIANDIIFNIIENSFNQIYSVKRFVDYEVWCIRKYANNEVNNLYKKSSLQDYFTFYDNDWNNGDTANISDYINEQTIPLITQISGKQINPFDLGIPRIIAVNHVYKYYAKKFNPSLV